MSGGCSLIDAHQSRFPAFRKARMRCDDRRKIKGLAECYRGCCEAAVAGLAMMSCRQEIFFA